MVKKIRLLIHFVLVLGLITVAAGATAATIHVPGDYQEIHDAVQAAEEGDVVLVAAGTYNDCTHETEGPGSTPACVIMKSGVTLRGAGPDDTIIDAELLGRGIFVENVEKCSIEDLQVTNAFAEIYGAGILLRHVGNSVRIENVKIVENGDGGIICINEASPFIKDVVMIRNYGKQGGGLAIEENCHPSVYNCLVDDNAAPWGAGVFIRSGCRPLIVGCTISNNVIDADFGNGGGITIQSSEPIIRDCDIINNITLGSGGGVAYVDGGGGVMYHCLIQGNDAAGNYSYGGGVSCSQSDPELSHLLILDNTCSGFYAEGGGMDFAFTPSPTVRNCTLSGNATGENGFAGGMYCQFGANPVIENCIIANSTAGEAMVCASGGNPTTSCSDLYGNAGGNTLCGVDGGNNFYTAPMFCGNAGIEYHLDEASPCAPENSGGCGLVGAEPVGCSYDVAVETTPQAHRALGNRPNPFNPKTSIFFVLNEAGPANVRIYDVSGRTVMSFYRDELPAGVEHEFTWNGRDRAGNECPSGIYLYELEANGRITTKRMSLIR